MPSSTILYAQHTHDVVTLWLLDQRNIVCSEINMTTWHVESPDLRPLSSAAAKFAQMLQEKKNSWIYKELTFQVNAKSTKLLFRLCTDIVFIA